MPEEIVETPQTVQPTEPKTTNWPKVVLAAVLGLGLLFASAYAGYYYGTQQVQQIEKPIPTPFPTPTSEEELSKAEKCYKELEGPGTSGISGMADPASTFCGCMGGEWDVEETPTGQRGLCKIGAKTYDAWEYFDDMNPYDNSYSECPLGDDAWVNFCEENKNSVYCETYQP